MGRPRHTSVAEQNVWMEQRIAELEAERDAAYKKGMERSVEIADRIKNGIRYDEELNLYVLCWTKREIEQAKKEADKIMKVLGKEIEK